MEPFCSLTHKSTLLSNGFHRRHKIQTKQHLFVLTYIQCKRDSKYANSGRKEMHFHYPNYWILFRIWVILPTSWTTNMHHFFLLPLFLWYLGLSLVFIHYFFNYFSLHKRWGGVPRTGSSSSDQPQPSRWNITAVLSIGASGLFLDIRKTFSGPSWAWFWKQTWLHPFILVVQEEVESVSFYSHFFKVDPPECHPGPLSLQP